MVRNPVMFVVEVGSVLTTALWIQALFGHGEAPAWYIGGVSLWLWFTVIFANFSEESFHRRLLAFQRLHELAIFVK